MIASIIAVALMTSCSDTKTYDVTVIGHSKGLLTGVQKAVVGIQSFDAITASGDTVKVNVSEEILLNHKIPFKAKMEKSETDNFGQIVSVE